MTHPRVAYDRAADAAYVYLTDPGTPTKAAHTLACDPVGVDGTVNLDFDEEGRLVGVEVLGAASTLPARLLESAERLDTRGA
ncbi:MULTISPECIES: DUF2283 domain-containing protein [Streptomyces]|uniref:DUF2283 domain-containing protein n=2 Tax=Streptomyces TaxID=1883 RepID=A0A100Y3Q9_9ACTN|nr:MULTISPECIES: DUF2283 domain-containing protein [Streptomyces]KUH37122.1 hypothetical protein ATE80_19860 [Streptomyces kanasensis]UUS33405.1 DUF2283 domain-containing protein [Streptomyces changanensis]